MTDPNLDAECAAVDVGGCATPVGSPCVYLPPSVNAGKPRAARYGINGAHPVRAYGAQQRSTGIADGKALVQPDLDKANRIVAAGEARIDELTSQVADLTAQLAGVQEHPVPDGALYVSAAGSDSNPGTQAAPRRTPKGGAVNVLVGVFPGFSWSAPANLVTTLMAAPGATATLDGLGTVKRALTNSGRCDLLGDLRFDNYVPTASTGSSCVVIYYGGTSAGSVIDGPTISNTSQAALGFQVPMVLTKLTVDGCGYSGILGTDADGTPFGEVQVFRTNRDSHLHDGQLAAIKMTRSADVVFSKGVHVEDLGPNSEAVGIWTDVSCQRPVVVGAKVLTGAGAPARIGLLLEETEGGTVAGCEIEGLYGVEVVATGHASIWENTITATSVALTVHQDRPKNSGTNPANLDPALVPWWAVGEAICNNAIVATAGFKAALVVYADAPYKLDAAAMLDALKGNTFTGVLSLGDPSAKRTNYTLAQLPGRLGSEYDAAPQPVPADVAALLAA